MKSIIKKILLIYIILVIIKIIFSYFIKTPTIYADSYFYIKGAKNLWLLKEYSIHGYSILKFPPLYSLVLSISFFFKNIAWSYLLIKIINSIISASVIFPAYLLSREFLSKRKSLIIAILVGVLPHNFIISNYIMSENLYYPLFLFAIYFIYKFFTTYKYRWGFLSGLFLGLCYLTRMISIVMLPAIFVIFCIFFYIELKQRNYYNIFKLFKKGLFILFIFILTILPWLFRNYFLLNSFNVLKSYSSKTETMGFGLTGKLAEYFLNVSIIKLILALLFTFLHWFIVHLGIIFLGLLIILPILYIYFIKDYKNYKKNLKIYILISVVFIFFVVLLTTMFSTLQFSVYNETLIWWLPGAPNTRYMEFILPLIVIGGFIYQKNVKNIEIKFKHICIISILLMLSFQLFFFSFYLIPVSNISLSYLGALGLTIGFLLNKPFNYILFMLSLGVLPFVIYFIFKRVSFKKFIYILIGLLLINNLIGYSAAVYNSNIWYDSEQIQLSLWLRDVLKKNENVIIDIRDGASAISKDNQTVLYNVDSEEELYCSGTVIGYWINNPIVIKNVENASLNGYILTMHPLEERELIKKTERIYVYK